MNKNGENSKMCNRNFKLEELQKDRKDNILSRDTNMWIQVEVKGGFK